LNQHLEEYEVNSFTMLLEPVQYGSKLFTKVIEISDEFLVPLKPLDVIKNSCKYFGVDYESRKKGTKQLIGYTRKVPIAIEPSNRIFFFPTTSPAGNECIWISSEHVENYRRIGPQQTLITFRNKYTHVLPVSYGMIEKQMLRTSLLKTKLLQRIEGRKMSFYLMDRPKTLQALEKSHDYE
jgi:competence protein ComK